VMKSLNTKQVHNKLRIRLRIIGTLSPTLKVKIRDMDLDHVVEYIPTLPHDQITRHQREGDALLLIIPAISHAKGILTGKLFEYLAANRPIICIGPEDGEAAGIIRECKAGMTFNRQKTNEIQGYLDTLVSQKSQGDRFSNDRKAVGLYDRKQQASMLFQKLFDQDWPMRTKPI